MKEEVLKLIPEFNEIKDAKLKEATLNVFCSAIEKGGWKVEDLDKIPFTLLINPCYISFLKHTRAVTKTCISAGKQVNETYKFHQTNAAAKPHPPMINMDHLVCGAILHDVGKLVEYKWLGVTKYAKSQSGEYLRHPFSGVGLCFGKGIPDEVMHIIAVHSKEGDDGKRSREAVLLHHADFMNFEIFNWDTMNRSIMAI